jgi:hypothetical protein
MPPTLEALHKRPPHVGADGMEVLNTAFTGTGTAGALCLTAMPDGGCYISWIADADCYIVFGSVAGMAVATSTNGFYLPAGVAMDFWHQRKMDDFFSVVQKTAAGTLKRYRSNS